MPGNIKLYQQAVLHKSTIVRKENGQLINNERLEFLGDAILDAVVGDIVYRHFERKKEGFLTNTRSKIVQRETLNKVAVEIGLDKLVRYNTHTSSHNSYLYGNAFEAFIGAIYLDQGYDRCMEFMQKRIIGQYIDLDRIPKIEVNFKSTLIEWGQKNKFNVTFDLIEQELDKDLSPIFCTEVHIEGVSSGIGKGYTKKESQQYAAHTALRRIKNEKFFKSLLLIQQQHQQELSTTENVTDSPEPVDTETGQDNL